MTSNTDAVWAQTQTTQNTTAWIMTPDSHNDNVNQSLGDVPADCIVLGLNATIPWDSPHNIISQQAWRVVERLRSGLFFPVLFFVGVPGNIVNMAVFRKQGLKDRINMCLFALALADLLNITFWFCSHAERIYTSFTDDNQIAVPSIRFLFQINLMGLIGLMYAPPFIMAVISVERCVCVLFPLHAQRCMPTKTLAAILFVTASFLVFFQFAVNAKLQNTCLHFMLTGETVWLLTEKPREQLQLNTAVVNYINRILYGFIIGMGCPIVVFVTTTITAVKLRQIVMWRRQASSSAASSSSSSSSAAVSSKEVGLTKMLICLSLEFFVLCIPLLLQKIWPLFNAGIIYGGPLHNTSYLLSILSQICVYTSSSVNFFVYYCTGTKFRHTLHAMIKRNSSSNNKSMASSTSVSITAARVERSDTCQ